MRELAGEEFRMIAGGSRSTTTTLVARVQQAVSTAAPMMLMPVTATTGVGGLIFTIGLAIYGATNEQQT